MKPIELQLYNLHKTMKWELQDSCENLVVVSPMVFEMLSLAPSAVTKSRLVT